MINIFNDCSTIFTYVYNYFVCSFSYYYSIFLFLLMFLFLCYRFPYCYSPYLFFSLLIFVLFILFFSLFLGRLINNVNGFFSSFIPVGTPMYICFLVCIAETISYVIRPFVLILRPFINISLGCVGGVVLGNLCFNSLFWFIVLFLLFFYEVFVVFVHWYIVSSILLFSINH